MALGKYAEKINQGIIDPEERYKKIMIEEIPVMLSDRGEIVCIPKNQEVFAAALLGQSGYGKSLLLNRIMMSLKNQWRVNISLLNDVSEESYHWSKPMENKKFNEFNFRWINQLPRASPIVYVYPNTNNLQLNKQRLIGKDYIKIVLPFAEILPNIGFYLSGVLEDFDLGKSGNYIRDVEDELKECQSSAEVREVLEEGLPGKDGKAFASMRAKIFNAFNNLFKEGILDITNPECHQYLRVFEKGKMDFMSNPFTCIMKAGLIPSFVTSNLATKKYKSEIFAHYVREIFKNNIKDFPNQKTFLGFDELRTVCEKDDEPASKAIGDVAARGRINEVGLVYATQFYNKIPNSVKGAKLNYGFIFRHNNQKIINEIANDFDLEKVYKEKIHKLKIFQCLAVASDKFVCYADGERYERQGPIVGQIFFPFSNHMSVSNREVSKEEDDDEDE